MGKLPDPSLHFRDLLTVHKFTERILIAQGIEATTGRIVRPSRQDAPGPSTMAPFPYTQPDKRAIIERCQLRKRVMALTGPRAGAGYRIVRRVGRWGRISVADPA
jgi:hypothetical protein